MRFSDCAVRASVVRCSHERRVRGVSGVRRSHERRARGAGMVPLCVRRAAVALRLPYCQRNRPHTPDAHLTVTSPQHIRRPPVPAASPVEKGDLEVITSGIGVRVDDLAREKQPRHALRHHGFRRKLRHGDSAGGDDRLVYRAEFHRSEREMLYYSRKRRALLAGDLRALFVRLYPERRTVSRLSTRAGAHRENLLNPARCSLRGLKLCAGRASFRRGRISYRSPCEKPRGRGAYEPTRTERAVRSHRSG